MNNYSFYLYVNLVNELMINLNDWHIPYDLSFPIVLQSFEDFKVDDFNHNVSEYEAMYDYINDDETLYSELRELNENDSHL